MIKTERRQHLFLAAAMLILCVACGSESAPVTTPTPGCVGGKCDDPNPERVPVFLRIDIDAPTAEHIGKLRIVLGDGHAKEIDDLQPGQLVAMGITMSQAKKGHARFQWTITDGADCLTGAQGCLPDGGNTAEFQMEAERFPKPVKNAAGEYQLILSARAPFRYQRVVFDYDRESWPSAAAQTVLTRFDVELGGRLYSLGAKVSNGVIAVTYWQLSQPFTGAFVPRGDCPNAVRYRSKWARISDNSSWEIGWRDVNHGAICLSPKEDGRCAGLQGLGETVEGCFTEASDEEAYPPQQETPEGDLTPPDSAPETDATVPPTSCDQDAYNQWFSKTEKLTQLAGAVLSETGVAQLKAQLDQRPCDPANLEAYEQWLTLFSENLERFANSASGLVGVKAQIIESLLSVRPLAQGLEAYTLWQNSYAAKFMRFVRPEPVLTDKQQRCLEKQTEAMPRVDSDAAYPVWLGLFASAFDAFKVGGISEDELALLKHLAKFKPCVLDESAAMAAWSEFVKSQADETEGVIDWTAEALSERCSD